MKEKQSTHLGASVWIKNEQNACKSGGSHTKWKSEAHFYPIVQGFHRTYATGAACQQRTLTPPDTWSCPTLGLACVLMSRPISHELVLSPDLWISNTPRYFSFASHSFQCNLTEKIAKMARKSVFKPKFRGLCTSVWNYPKLFIDTVTQIFCVPVFDIMRVILKVSYDT